MNKAKQTLTKLLSLADIEIGGSNPWDIQVHDDRFYGRVLGDGSLGLGESYMDGWWDCPAIDQFIYKVLDADLDHHVKSDWKLGLELLRDRLINFGSKSKAFEVGEEHYDAGNDLYRAMLDRRMVYTCGYWKNAENLDEAQEAKLDLVCKKIGLQEGQSVLDIGSGWGSFMGFAAEKYKAKPTGVTVSKEQKKLADDKYASIGVTTKLIDYRDIDETFDHVVSIGMFEHVGYKNYRTFFEVAERSLKDKGLFLLHTIGSNTTKTSGDEWSHKYIFPNGMLPSTKQVGKAVEGLFVIEDWHNFGADYDRTLMAWHENFEKNWDNLKDQYDEKFYRMWRYYLLSFAGSFRARKIQLWQIVLSKKGVRGGYNSVR